MKHNHTSGWLSFALGILLIAASAFCLFACKEDTSAPPAQNQTVETIEGGQTPATDDGTTLGEGEKSFTFCVTDDAGKEKTYQIRTDADTVGEALIDLGLIEGEADDYGLYVKKVDGLTADYDTSGTYWAFYINGEYALSGVDQTPIVDGEIYSFRVEKG